MEEKNKNLLPKLSEPVVRLSPGANPNSSEELSEEELTGNWGVYQAGIDASIFCLQQSNCLQPFAGDNAE
ncbi:hypothetical protein RIVM261_062690 [Rivularia sp. IAM M-261]|nr:hypothetical protein RIVM261_062690 [Rivularia sp. IAM M-261]